MASLVAPRLGAAGFLAVTGLLGTTTGTVVDPARACATPMKTALDRKGFDLCTDIVIEQRIRGEIGSPDEFEDALQECCELNGGEVVLHDQGWDCEDPAEDAPAQLPRFPDLGDATATWVPVPPPPPTGPILPNVPPAQTG